MWAVNSADMEKKIADESVYWGKNSSSDGSVASTLLSDVGTNSSASKELQGLFSGKIVFETPKPSSLLKHLAQIATRSNDIILD